MIDVVAFDADDTLWHNERLFVDTQARFRELLAHHEDPAVIEQRLFETEIRNLSHYGYGVKSFTLSMVETAIELTDGRIAGREVEEILRLGREMLLAPVELLDGADEVVESLARERELMLVTVGDLLDQETKLARSGLGDFFSSVEIVSRKDRSTYERLLDRHGLEPSAFAMVGNSLRSDILPVAEMGARAIHVPADTGWAHDDVRPERLRGLRYETATSIREVPELLARQDAS
ncbi:MAG: HAD family hydrolase [Gemmatimonadota bacterium]|nr:HAD family hydrolase [Gemmatimonadota bacterium]